MLAACGIAHARSQDGSPDTLAHHTARSDAPTLSLRLDDVSLSSVLKRLSMESDLRFYYSADRIPTDQTLSVDLQHVSPVEAMRRILYEAGLTYRVAAGGQVIPVRPDRSSRRQQTGVVEGTVTDAQTGEPLPGANVVVDGTDRGAATANDGSYRLTDVPTGSQTLVASFVGYETARVEVDIAEGETMVRDIALDRQTFEGQEVVVTALGVARESRSLGYAVQKVEGEEVSQVREPNVINSLAGRMAGVRVTSGAGGVGASSRLVIRGENTIGNNQPLFVIDGVPVDNSNLKSGTGSFQTSGTGDKAAIDFGNAMADLNPDDIASINVLKGPSAAALYGSRASNGVVVIETKSGNRAGGLGVEFNSSYMLRSILTFPDYQNEYGQGTGDTFAFIDGINGDGGSDYSFGPPLDQGLEFVQFDSDGEPAPWVSRPDNVRNFFRTGQTVTNNVAVSGGNEAMSYRASYTNLREVGIVPNTDLTRHNVGLSTNFDLTDRIRGRVTANYVHTTSGNRMGGGYDDQNVFKQFSWFGRQVDVEALKQYAEGNELNWNRSWHANPYFITSYNTNSQDKDRLFGRADLTYELTDRLQVQARAGLDQYADTREIKRAYNDYEFPRGAYTRDVYRVTELNTDVLVTYRPELGEDVGVELSGGGNRMQRRFNQDLSRARQLAVPDVFNMSNARGIPIAENWVEKKQINSLYALGEFSFRDYLFLNVTARNDWSSTLPDDNNSYFYPSISASTILSDIVDLPDPISFAKVRGSWSQVGSDTDPYQLQLIYNSSVDNWGSTTTVTVPNTLPNVDLKPEITSSYEVGANVEFFTGRLGIDLTYYNSTTRNQIISGSIASETGFSRQIFNAGRIANRGIELVLSGTPIDVEQGLRWDVELNYDRNRNEVVELSEGVDKLRLYGGNLFGMEVVAMKGEPYGTLVGRGMQRTEEGEVIYGSDGLPLLTDEAQVQGNYQPDWSGSLSNTLSYRGVDLRFLIDARIGGEIYSGTNVIIRRAGTGASTVEGRENGIVGDGVVENEDGSYSPNTTRVEAQDWYFNYYGYNNTEVSVFDASFVKLREVVLSYTLPRPWAQALYARGITLSAVGRNLAILHKNAPNIDPETVIVSDAVQGLEFGQIPSTRTYGLKMSLSF